jgi:hypothetical protein
MGIHNIQCWKNSAVGVVGFATGTQALIREAIDDPDRGFRAQIARGVTDDGLWYEGSMGYHQYTMEALWPLAEAARHNGVDLYTERFRSLFDAPLALALPNGDAPGFNDNAGGNVLRSGSLYELAYARWKTPAYGRLVARSERRSLQALLYGVETVPEGPMIPEESVLMRAAGFAMLRAPGMAAAVRFGMHGGGHGHPDKLNLVTFAAGQLFGLDPGSINYGVPLHREWYRSTIAHNTVSVDHQLQANADGKLESWETVGGVTTFAASADDVYPGVKLRRTIRLGDGRIEDRFECASEQEHTYDWSFHAPGKFESSLTFSPAGTPPGTDNGYQHLEKAAAARASGDWWARWEAGGVQMTLTVKGAPGTEVFTALGPGRNPADRVPMVIIRRRGTKTVFECTHTKN